jgi:hypothetical protein
MYENQRTGQRKINHYFMNVILLIPMLCCLNSNIAGTFIYPKKKKKHIHYWIYNSPVKICYIFIVTSLAWWSWKTLFCCLHINVVVIKTIYRHHHHQELSLNCTVTVQKCVRNITKVGSCNYSNGCEDIKLLLVDQAFAVKNIKLLVYRTWHWMQMLRDLSSQVPLNNTHNRKMTKMRKQPHF